MQNVLAFGNIVLVTSPFISVFEKHRFKGVFSRDEAIVLLILSVGL